jgi:TRAP-type C4-dicarboxylate transport system permease small subunit
VSRFCDHLAGVARGLVIVLTGVMLAALSLQIVMRYVFGRATSWTEELALACFTWSMLLAIAVGVRDGIHVRMDLLVDRLPAPLQKALETLVAGIIALTGLFIAWAGVAYTADSAGFMSAAIGYPMTYLYSSAPVCGALIAVFALERVLRRAAARADHAMPVS